MISCMRKEVSMKDTFKLLLEEVKQCEDLEMIYLFIGSVLCFLADLFYIRYHVHHCWLLECFRFTYFAIGFLSHFFVTNRFFRNIRLEKEANQREENILETLRCLDNEEYNIMHKFAEIGCLNLVLDTDEEKQAAVSLCTMFDFVTLSGGNRINITANMAPIVRKAYFYN